MKKIKKISPPHGRMGQEDCPYCDECRKSGSNFCGRCGKQLNIPPKKFVSFLLEKKYIYRDKKGRLMPYAEKNNGLFELKEQFNDKTQWAGTQTLITPKGRETFRLLMVM